MDAGQQTPLTAWSIFRFCAGGLFCLMGGLSITPAGINDIGGILGGAIGIALIACGVAYAARGRKKVRNWNAFAQWFFWVTLILPALVYSTNVRR